MASYSQGRILLADDEAGIRDMLKCFVRQHGYEAVLAHDGQQALELVDAAAPDLVLLDICMPTVNGLEVCRALKARHATQHIPVILLTALGTPDDVVNGLTAGADDYLAKPVHLPELGARIANLVGRKRLFDELKSHNDDLVETLGHQSQSIAELFSLSLRMNQAANLEDLLSVLVASVERTFRYKRTSVYLFDGRGGLLRLARSAGWDWEGPWASEFEPPLDLLNSIFAVSRPTVIESDDASAPLTAYARELGASAPTVITPLHVGSHRVGVMHLTGRDPAAPTSTEMAWLTYLAEAASVAIANRRREIQIRETQDVTIFAMAKLAENRDELTGNHLHRVQTYCRELAKKLRTSHRLGPRVTEEFITEVCRAAPLHDIGKVGIPDQILLKPGRLTPDEFAIMTRHTLIGGRTLQEAGRLLRHDSFLATAQEICFSHHERWDGAGYPWKLAGEEIPLSARIVALADVYDALTTVRPYKPAFPHEEARRIILEGRGSHFDPDIVDAFESINDRFQEIHLRLKDPVSPPDGSAD